MQTSYKFTSGAEVHVMQPSAHEACTHRGSGQNEIEHLAGQVRFLRDAQDVGRVYSDADIRLLLRFGSYLVANHDKEFGLLTALGYAEIDTDEEGVVGIPEIALHPYLTKEGKRPEPGRWPGRQPQNHEVIAAILKSVADNFEDRELQLTSKDPSDRGDKSMSRFGLKRDGELYVASAAVVAQRLAELEVRASVAVALKS